MKKGDHLMRNGQKATIYGPSRFHEGRFAGVIDNTFTLNLWHPNGIWHPDGITESRLDIVGAWVK